jgi:hypothetical protein
MIAFASRPLTNAKPLANTWNEYGKFGWELVTIHHDEYGIMAYFKRPVREEPPYTDPAI